MFSKVHQPHYPPVSPSTTFIDRRNIIFEQSKQLLSIKYKNTDNFYYLKLLPASLVEEIDSYNSKYHQDRNYDIHPYEINNKIYIPITKYTCSTISSVSAT